jgi:hypothetical protein
MEKVKIECIEIAGFPAFLESLRMPFKKEVRSKYESWYSNDTVLINKSIVTMDAKDLKLASVLKSRGDEHAKSIRLIIN